MNQCGDSRLGCPAAQPYRAASSQLEEQRFTAAFTANDFIGL
jgi:hypothetical protein